MSASHSKGAYLSAWQTASGQGSTIASTSSNPHQGRRRQPSSQRPDAQSSSTRGIATRASATGPLDRNASARLRKKHHQDGDHAWPDCCQNHQLTSAEPVKQPSSKSVLAEWHSKTK